MNNCKRFQQIEDHCREIISLDMWYELPEFIFWSIADVMDGSNDEFAMNVYKNIENKFLKILLHTPILVSIVESLQSNSIVKHITKLCEREESFDEFLLSDIESCLFINYEDNNSKTAKSFNKSYNELKNIVKSSREHIYNEKSIFDDLDKMQKFLEGNKYEYFTYVRAYWLSLYFCDISQRVIDKDKLSHYQTELSILLPNVILYNE
ncbi:aminopeptidase [Escherichia albertii]|uniref:aminopeptidase n=1 Tax=Escherichia albertii TaxID=208962 RepID=UPI001F271FCE|nr:aminopeptidase [Escherichia albertii]MCE7719870.1 aminopeptidase [Escherichia albertii]MCE7723684.1 aminopeptidase [Escherichia albertii]